MFQIPSHVIDDPPYVFAYEMIFFFGQLNILNTRIPLYTRHKLAITVTR